MLMLMSAVRLLLLPMVTFHAASMTILGTILGHQVNDNVRVCVKHTTNAQTRTIHTWPVLRNIVSCMLKRRRKCRHSRKWQININSLLSSLTYAIRYFYTQRKVVYHIKWNIFLLKNGYSQHLKHLEVYFWLSLKETFPEKDVFDILLFATTKFLYILLLNLTQVLWYISLVG